MTKMKRYTTKINDVYITGLFTEHDVIIRLRFLASNEQNLSYVFKSISFGYFCFNIENNTQNIKFKGLFYVAILSRRRNAIQTIDNEMSQLINCLNYIRRD